MAVNFKTTEAFVDQISITETYAPEAQNSGATLEKTELQTSADITGIEVRLTKALIKDNGTKKILGFPGLASMYLLVVVISDMEDPIQNLDIKGFARVDDNEELPVDRSIFYWKKEEGNNKTPSQVHVFASILKSKQGLRDVGSALQKVKDDTDYKSIVSTVTSLVKAGTPIGAAADIIFSVASIMGKYLGDVKDKPWITMVQSFTDINGDWDNLGAVVRGVENERAAISLKLIVRDKGRDEAEELA